MHFLDPKCILCSFHDLIVEFVQAGDLGQDGARNLGQWMKINPINDNISKTYKARDHYGGYQVMEAAHNGTIEQRQERVIPREMLLLVSLRVQFRRTERVDEGITSSCGS